MLTSLAMIDSSLTREDAPRVPAAHCSNSGASRSQCQPQQFDLDIAGEPRTFLMRSLQALPPSFPLPSLLACTELREYFTPGCWLASGCYLFLGVTREIQLLENSECIHVLVLKAFRSLTYRLWLSLNYFKNYFSKWTRCLHVLELFHSSHVMS